VISSFPLPQWQTGIILSSTVVPGCSAGKLAAIWAGEQSVEFPCDQ